MELKIPDEFNQSIKNSVEREVDLGMVGNINFINISKISIIVHSDFERVVGFREALIENIFKLKEPDTCIISMRFDGKLCQGELPGKYLKAYIQMLKLISAILSDTKLREKDYKKYENEPTDEEIYAILERRGYYGNLVKRTEIEIGA